MAGALTPEQSWALIKRYGTIDNAFEEARTSSPELQELWNSYVLGAWAGRTRDFWKAWWKLALPVLGVDSGLDEEAIRAGDAAAPRPRRREKRAAKGTAGSPDALYPREEIKRALLLWRSRSTSPQQVSQSSIARPGFSRVAVRRVIRLDEHGAFELGPRGGLRLLGINGEFRAVPKKVSLRALERALGLEPLA
jgi:hypothetical protein